MTLIGEKSVTEMSIDTNNDCASLYGQVISHVLNLTAYGCAVFDSIDLYGRAARNG